MLEEGPMATQTDIAMKAGVHRSTVSKVLNRVPNHRVSQETVIKILRAAKKLGYEPKNLRKDPERRKCERTNLNLKVEIAIVLKTGRVYTEGEATMKNLSVAGALLSNVMTTTGNLPLEPFFARLTIRDGAGGPISFRADFVRIQSGGNLEFGIQFDRLPRNARDELTRILEG
jgi:transcriptional regulator with XRE-family HTH domain